MKSLNEIYGTNPTRLNFIFAGWGCKDEDDAVHTQDCPWLRRFSRWNNGVVGGKVVGDKVVDSSGGDVWRSAGGGGNSNRSGSSKNADEDVVPNILDLLVLGVADLLDLGAQLRATRTSFPTLQLVGAMW